MKIVKPFIQSILIVFLLGLSSCEDATVQVQAISLVSDQTQGHFEGLSYADYQKLSLLEQTPNAGQLVSIAGITEMPIGLVSRFEIAPEASKWLGNELKRTTHIKSIQGAIQDRLSSLEYKDRGGSVIFKTIASQLNWLKQSPATNKTLLVKSDLMEYSSYGNFYRLDSLEQFKSCILEEFPRRYPADDLQGIKVYFLLPKGLDRAQAAQFEQLALLYKELLESNHAEVVITAQLY